MNNYVAIIICHGTLADGFMNNMQELFGDTSRLRAFTNQNKNVNELQNEIEQELERDQTLRPIFFVDLRGGSCWRVAKLLAKDRNERFVLSGVNTAMLVQFLTKAADYDNEKDLCDMIIEKSKLAILGEK